MRYSLTKLLLEDTEAQGFDIKALPDAETAKKISPVTALGIIKGIGKAFLETIGSRMIDWIVMAGSPRCKAIVRATRGYAKRRDRDVKLMMASRSHENFIRAVYTDTSRYTPDQRKALSVCLGIYEDPLVGSRPWEGTTDIHGVSPDEVITQGCRSLRNAAGIGAYNDMISNIHSMSSELQKCLGDEGLSSLAAEFGVDIKTINIDLTEDRYISAIIEKRDKAFQKYQQEINIEGREPFFAMQSAVVARIIPIGATVADICPPDPARGSPGVIPEGRDRSEGTHAGQSSIERLLIEALADAVTSAEPRNAQEALEAFKSKSPANGIFVEKIAQRTGIKRPKDVASLGNILTLKRTGINNRLYNFPKKEEEGYALAGATSLSAISPEHYTLERVAAGLIISYLRGFRPKGVSRAVLQIIIDVLAPRAASIGSGGDVAITSRSIGKDIVQNLADKRNGLRQDPEKQAALNLVLYHLILVGERGEKDSRGRRGRGDPPRAESLIQGAYDTMFGWHALGDLRPVRDDNIEFAPGRPDPDWKERFMQSFRSDKSDKNEPKYMTSIRMRPQIDIAEPEPEEEAIEDMTELPEEEAAGADLRGIALRNINMLWDQVKQMRMKATSARSKLAQQSVDPIASSVGGVLPMLSYCIEVSLIANHYRAVTFGAGAKIIGLSYPDSFVTSDKAITPEDVWRKLCELTGAQYGTARVSMKSRNAVREWADVMSADNQMIAASGVARLAAEQLIYPAGCITKAAIDGYRTKRVITQKDIDDAYAKKINLFPGLILTTTTSRPTVNVSSHDVVGSRRSGSALRRAVKTVARVTDHDQIDIPEEYNRPDTEGVVKLVEDAPRVINIAAVLARQPSFDDSAPGAPGPGPTTPPPPATPPATPPASPPTSPTAPTAPTPTTPPGGPIVSFNYSVFREDPAAAPANVPSGDDEYSHVTIKVGGIEIYGQAVGSTAQAANAVNGKYGDIELVGIDARPEGEAADRVHGLGGEGTIRDVVSAAIGDVSGTHRADLAFALPQPLDG